MKILVTGSSGFIGFHLCKFLSSKKLKVIGIDNHNNYYSNKIKLKIDNHNSLGIKGSILWLLDKIISTFSLKVLE